MRHFRATPEEKCAEIAAAQHGAITTAQLLAAGFTRDAVKRRVAAGRLHRVYRGVYAVGHMALSSEGRWMAAVLAVGEGAVLSHRSAAEHWKLLEGCSSPIHITVPGDAGKKKRPGLLVHRSSSLDSEAWELRDGIAVTTPARTFADLRRTEPSHVVRKVAQAASFRGLETGDEGEERGVRSELERRFLRFCLRNGLPQPAVNVRVGPLTVDFLWRQQRLVVETDGWKAHRGRAAFEDDHARDLIIRGLGYDVLRFTWRLLETDSALVLALLRRHLLRGAVS